MPDRPPPTPRPKPQPAPRPKVDCAKAVALIQWIYQNHPELTTNTQTLEGIWTLVTQGNCGPLPPPPGIVVQDFSYFFTSFLLKDATIYHFVPPK